MSLYSVVGKCRCQDSVLFSSVNSKCLFFLSVVHKCHDIAIIDAWLGGCYVLLMHQRRPVWGPGVRFRLRSAGRPLILLILCTPRDREMGGRVEPSSTRSIRRDGSRDCAPWGRLAGGLWTGLAGEWTAEDSIRFSRHVSATPGFDDTWELYTPRPPLRTALKIYSVSSPAYTQT